MRRIVALGVFAMVLCPSFGVAAFAAELNDAKLAQQCPGMAVWMKAHPHGEVLDAARDAQRTFTQPALRAELLSMADEDARTRSAAIADNGKHPALGAAVVAADGRHLARLKRIDATYGFPSEAQVGAAGVHAAWLLTQHADRDPGFQQHVLDELRPRVGKGGIRGQDFAMLTDRVLAAQGKPQRYGTQFAMANGVLQAKPVEDADNVDKRRADVGLPPLADYACMLRMVYQTPSGR